MMEKKKKTFHYHQPKPEPIVPVIHLKEKIGKVREKGGEQRQRGWKRG